MPNPIVGPAVANCDCGGFIKFPIETPPDVDLGTASVVGLAIELDGKIDRGAV